MIETNTTWEDSSYDCDHCGGRILKRIDHESGRPANSCFQCEQCGCQWTLNREVLRVGKLRSCRQAQRERLAQSETGDPYTRWLLVGLGILALLLLLRFGGIVVLRFVLPVVVGGVALYLLVWYGKKQEWW